MRYLGEDEVTQMMGIGYVGEVRLGPDGNPYQWVQGVDGLGNPIGGWRKWGKRLLRNRLLRKAVQFIPGVGPVVATAMDVAKTAFAGTDGLGALYQAPDGTVYQVQGLAEDEELRGLAEDEELRGLAEDEELRGLAEDEELRGLAEDEELRDLAEDEELQGYVRDDGVSGVEAYVPHQPASTRWFTRPAQPPEMWKPMW